MAGTDQIAAAARFRARHREGPALLLPNAWDGASARIFAAAGFEHVATTSAGVAWALGYPDGEVAPWDEVVAATGRIVRAAGVPVTADIEAAYGPSPAAVGRHVEEIIAAGVVGINLEDGTGGGVRDEADALARLAAARAAGERAGVALVINARCDIVSRRHGPAEGRLAATIARCRAYLAAGADCVYPFGLRDEDEIATVLAGVGGPVNVTGRPGMPDAAALSRLGVARITLASAPALVAMSATADLARALRANGSFAPLASPLHHPEAQRLFLGRN